MALTQASRRPRKRWRVVISYSLATLETGAEVLHEAAAGLFDEIADMQDFVERGPDWTLPGYRITITYNLSPAERG